MLDLTLEYTKTYIKELFRDRTAAFFTLLFPAILLLAFGSQVSSKDHMYSYVIYCNYAVQCIVFQSLGITVATARSSKWAEYLKTLPVGDSERIAGRVLANLFFATISLAVVIAVNALNRDVNLSLQQQSIIILCALLGGIPMALLAIWLGSLLSPGAARSVFVILNLMLLFGAFSLSSNSVWNAVQQFVPSYQWLMFTVSLLSHQVSNNHLVWMVNYSLLFYLLIIATSKIIKS